MSVAGVGTGSGHLFSPRPPSPSGVWCFSGKEKVSATPAELSLRLRGRLDLSEIASF